MGEGASSVFGPPRPLPHGQVVVFRFVTTEATAVWAGGSLQFLDHRGPRHVGFGASSALGPPRFLPHRRGDVFRFWTTEALAHGRWGLFRFGTTKAAAACA